LAHKYGLLNGEVVAI